LDGELIGGTSADWQIVLPHGTALGDIRYTLRTESGALLYVRSKCVRHRVPRFSLAPPAATRSTRASIRSAPGPARNLCVRTRLAEQGIFIVVGGRQAGVVAYETYPVG